MNDKPISVRLGARRMAALERYLAENSNETRNGIIAGAVEDYLKATGFWDDNLPAGSRIGHPDDRRRPTLSERVKRLEDVIFSPDQTGR